MYVRRERVAWCARFPSEREAERERVANTAGDTGTDKEKTSGHNPERREEAPEQIKPPHCFQPPGSVVLSLSLSYSLAPAFVILPRLSFSDH